MITTRILELVEYGLVTGLIQPEDKIYIINSLMELFQIDDMEDAVIQEFDIFSVGELTVECVKNRSHGSSQHKNPPIKMKQSEPIVPQ